ncbi:MAG: ribbon-helix-helix protein, CopG family [Thermoleophilia bacterium]|nr:ribbon-helix-helix protein, CopG family [Thermoleophilia bacterium]
MLCTASIRTQLYLTEEQRAQLAELTQRTGVSLAEIIRTALDRCLSEPSVDRGVTRNVRDFTGIPGLQITQLRD